jgi:hypothetical protein
LYFVRDIPSFGSTAHHFRSCPSPHGIPQYWNDRIYDDCISPSCGNSSFIFSIAGKNRFMYDV